MYPFLNLDLKMCIFLESNFNTECKCSLSLMVQIHTREIKKFVYYCNNNKYLSRDKNKS